MKRLVAITVITVCLQAVACRARPSVLGAEMQRLGVRTALLVASQAIDEHPVWSPDGRYLAVNVDAKWSRIDLSTVHLVEATWRKDQPIGAQTGPTHESRIREATVRKWEKSARFEPRRIVTQDGTTIELRQEELGTAFVITKKGGQPETLWTSGMENCYGLALSPDNRSVAYVCERNGILVTRL